MKKWTLVFAFMAFGLSSVQAQMDDLKAIAENSIKAKNKDTIAWLHEANAGLGFSQGLLHNSPAGGELASLTFNALFEGSLSYFHNRHIWNTSLSANYGLLYTYSNDFIPRKTDDRIALTSRYGYRVKQSSDFYVVGLLDLKSQFSKGYDYDAPNWRDFSTSDFLSPLYVIMAPGMEYHGGEEFSLFFSPLGFRGTFVNRYYTFRNPQGAFGVPFDKTFRFELGAYLTARYSKEFSDHVSFRSRLDLYSNYLAKNSYDHQNQLIKKDNPGNIDIFWDNYAAFTFAKYFSLNVGLTAVYDNDVPYKNYYLDANNLPQPKNEPFEGLGWWQIKELISIGFNYKF